MNDTTIQGLTSYETVIAFFVVLSFFVFLYLVNRHNTVFNQSDNGSPGQSKQDKQKAIKAPDFVFTDVMDQGITCKYKGVEVMYSTVANDMVHFFWSVGRKEALSPVSYPKNHTMSLENMMKRAVRDRFEEKPDLVTKISKIKDGEFSVISYEGKTSAASRFKDKNNKIELTF